MKRWILAVAVVCTAGAAGADPLTGMWKTEVDDGAYAHVQIEPCGPAFCGKIAKTFRDGAEYKSENLGKQLVIDMRPIGDGEYEGQVWRPSNNKIYYGTIELQGSKLRLAGCVAGGLICSKQSWTRLN
ncbi:DUF2147 domain-containing protein [Tabrizicola sp.]|uniref:DUF2147 domain-containing protein n=1 Tax=Tabrizicola sp. TaxID=2005166 RepID=UPI003D2C4A00